MAIRHRLVGVTTEPTLLIARPHGRADLYLLNAGGDTVYLGGPGEILADAGLPLPPGQTLSLPDFEASGGPDGGLYAVAVAGTVNVRMLIAD